MLLPIHCCYLTTILALTIFFSTSSFSDAQSCNGILVSYAYTSGLRLPPNVTNAAEQPYRFESTLTVLNNGLDELKSWKVSVGFDHDELLVSASNAVLADGTTLPASVGNGTVFAGYPMTDLKTAVATAGDLTQMQVQIDLVGTVFGVAPPSVPMPKSISLANDGFLCRKSTTQGKNASSVCCTRDPKFKTNITTDEEFLPRQNGDLSIMYDVIRTYDSNYWAEVTIGNHNPLGRLDNWRLSWDWMNDEFIYSMKGAYPSVVDASECLFGKQGTFYRDLDFATVLNCAPFALLLAAVPRRLPADAALVAAPCLRDLWSLQIGFSLNADNCHPSSTIRGSTQCDELHPPRHIDPPSISMLT